MMSMDLIRDPNETIPDALLDIIFNLSNTSYGRREESDEMGNCPLYEDLKRLVNEILVREGGKSCLLWTGLVLGQCVMPTITSQVPGNQLPEVVINMVWGFWFMHNATNLSYARSKLALPDLKEDVREGLFCEENSLAYLENWEGDNSYKDGITFYYKLLGLCIGNSFLEEVVEILRLCMEGDALCTDSENKQYIISWILEEVIPAAWDMKLPCNLFNKESSWYQVKVV